MTKSKLIPYINRFNGDVKIVTKSQSRNLSEDYSKVEFIKNEKGERVMRLQLANATVDVLESETKEVIDGEPITE